MALRRTFEDGECNADECVGSSSFISLAARRRVFWGGRSSIATAAVEETMKTKTRKTVVASLSSSTLMMMPSVVFTLRGGGGYDDSDEDVSDESEADGDDFDVDEDDFGFFDDADMEMAEDDFGEDGTIERTIAAWKKTPPFTKAYLSASMAITALGYVTNKNEFPSLFLLEWKPILTRLQIWRPFTAFLNFGPFGLGYLMTGHFVWTYMSTLERLNHDRPYDFWIMIVFGCCSMVAGYTFLKISPRFLGHNLSTFLVYVWSRYHEGMEVNMFELFNTRAELLPWFFLAQTFLLEGEVPVLDLLGILFGHIYHHCKTTNIIKTPRVVIDWYNGDSESARSIRAKYKTISSDFEMQ